MQKDSYALGSVTKENSKVFDVDIRQALSSLMLVEDTSSTHEEKIKKLFVLLDCLFCREVNLFSDNTRHFKKLILLSNNNSAIENGNLYLLAYAYKKLFKGYSQSFDVIWNETVNTVAKLQVFIGIIRSGIFGVKSLGGHLKTLIAEKLNSFPEQEIKDATTIMNTSVRDIIILSHPKPKDNARSLIFSSILSIGTKEAQIT